jgi:hypothetical protein
MRLGSFMMERSEIFGGPSSESSLKIESQERTCGDYQVSLRLTQGGAQENFKGTRPSYLYYQQDRAFVGTTDRRLEEADLKQAFQEASARTVNCIDGSTGSIFAINPTGLSYVANIADSPVMAFIVTAAGTVTGEYLIDDAHESPPGRLPIDQKKVPADYANDALLTKRFYNISVTRAFGDWIYSLGTDADIRAIDVQSFLQRAGDNGHVFLCVASDGICPPEKIGFGEMTDALWIAHYAELIQSSLKTGAIQATASSIATLITDEALVRRRAQAEQDNILVQVTELQPARQGTLYMAVCDGHRAADYAGTDFRGCCAQLAAETLLECLSKE